MSNQALEQRDGFKSKWGFILACIGSAVGMGNIWRFPYLAAQYGVGEDPEKLIVKAEAFAIRAGGRSPRVAKQFIELCKAGVLQ